MLGQVTFEFALRADGWVHLDLADWTGVLRGPVGLVLYLLFVPWVWLVPPRWKTAYLIVTSLLFSLATVGPAYVVWLVGVCLAGWFALQLAHVGPYSLAVRRTTPRTAACLLWAIGFALLLRWPQPAPLPPVKFPLYFYLHWAGIAYVFLKVYHLIIDTTADRLAKPRFGEYLAYLLFAPTLRMGPIFRADDFLPYLHDRSSLSHRAFRRACLRIVLGLLRWGAVVGLGGAFPAEVVFAAPTSLPIWKLWLSVIAQPMAIYLWLSGYADIAIGTGRLMGIVVPENFHYPWVSRSIREFWRRWHLTLGAWLRDYIYIPLGGSRRHVFLNYFVTFTFCGVWHGTYLSYILWGMSQGIGLSINRTWGQFWERAPKYHPQLYASLRRIGLVDGPLPRTMAWVITFGYQITTIAIFMDEAHAGRRFLPALIGLGT